MSNLYGKAKPWGAAPEQNAAAYFYTKENLEYFAEDFYVLWHQNRRSPTISLMSMATKVKPYEY